MCGWGARYSGSDRLPNNDARARAEPWEEAAHGLRRDSDAAFGRREIFARDVEEDGAAGAAFCRSKIVVDDDDDIVEPVGAPEALVACRSREADRLVVGAVGGIVAPAGVAMDGGDGQRGPGRETRSER